MNQQALWIDSWTSAVSALVDACGGPKRVASELRPDLPADEAGAWLMRTVSNKRREVLPPEHLIKLLAIGRRHNCDVLAGFLCDQAGYEPPRPIQIEAESARVTSQMSEMMAQMSREMERLQRLQALSAR